MVFAASASITLTAIGLALAGGSALPSDAIRVGGPSAPGDVKFAFVGSSASRAGADFEVRNARGQVVLRGKLDPADGSPAPWRHAAVADLSDVRTAGAFTVRVGSVVSRAWVVRSDATSEPLRLMLRFFATQSDGRERSPSHGPAHLNDATVASGPHKGERIDLTGGWMDAGDMIHFTHTTAFAAVALQAAGRLDARNRSRLNAAADVGVRWLVKAHPAPDLFIYQVGDLRDHEVGFRRPDADDRSSAPGIGRRFASPAVSADLAGKTAAALALAADRAGGAARAALLEQAEDWYAMGKKSRRAGPVVRDGLYAGSSWRDDMAVGAAALYRSTGRPAYLNDAVAYLRASSVAVPLGWDDVAALAAADLCGTLGAPPAPEPARRFACSKLKAGGEAAVASAATNAFATPGPFGWGQTGANGGAGAVAALAARAGAYPDGARVAAAARDWLFGRNPWGASFVVGFGPVPARRPHHWAQKYTPGEPRGAVVGGPAPRASIVAQGFKPPSSPFDTPQATYEDRTANYVTSEPAIDYTATSVLLLAALSAG